jgi:transposase
LLPALSLDGMIYAKIVEGSFTAERFISFIEGLLSRMNPFPGKNSVVIMDNAAIHRNSRITEMIESRYDECVRVGFC